MGTHREKGAAFVAGCRARATRNRDEVGRPISASAPAQLTADGISSGDSEIGCPGSAGRVRSADQGLLAGSDRRTVAWSAGRVRSADQGLLAGVCWSSQID